MSVPEDYNIDLRTHDLCVSQTAACHPPEQIHEVEHGVGRVWLPVIQLDVNINLYYNIAEHRHRRQASASWEWLQNLVLQRWLMMWDKTITIKQCKLHQLILRNTYKSTSFLIYFVLNFYMYIVKWIWRLYHLNMGNL